MSVTFSCIKCKRKFTTKDKKNKHEKKCGNTIFYCKLCKTFFQKKEYFLYHQKNESCEAKCKKCGSSFSRQNYFFVHVKWCWSRVRIIINQNLGVVMVLKMRGQDILSKFIEGGKTYLFALFCPFFTRFYQLLSGQLPPSPAPPITTPLNQKYF